MQDQLQAYSDLDVTWVEAIDGTQLSVEALSKLYNREKALKFSFRDLTRAEIGCSLSHQKCYKELLRSDADFGLILEDDVIISNPEILTNNNLHRFLNSPDPILLSCSTGTPVPIVKRYKAKRIGPNYTIAPIFSGVCAAAYFVNRAAAQYLLRNFFPVFCVADKWRLMSDGELQVWAFTSSIVGFHPNSKVSTIKEKSVKAVRKRSPTLGEAIKDRGFRLKRKVGLTLGLLQTVRPLPPSF